MKGEKIEKNGAKLSAFDLIYWKYIGNGLEKNWKCRK